MRALALHLGCPERSRQTPPTLLIVPSWRMTRQRRVATVGICRAMLNSAQGFAPLRVLGMACLHATAVAVGGHEMACPGVTDGDRRFGVSCNHHLLDPSFRRFITALAHGHSQPLSHPHTPTSTNQSAAGGLWTNGRAYRTLFGRCRVVKRWSTGCVQLSCGFANGCSVSHVGSP